MLVQSKNTYMLVVDELVVVVVMVVVVVVVLLLLLHSLVLNTHIRQAVKSILARLEAQAMLVQSQDTCVLMVADELELVVVVDSSWVKDKGRREVE